jgi:hypothetical protein
MDPPLSNGQHTLCSSYGILPPSAQSNQMVSHKQQNSLNSSITNSKNFDNPDLQRASARANPQVTSGRQSQRQTASTLHQVQMSQQFNSSIS